MEEDEHVFRVKDANGFFICSAEHREDLHRRNYRYAGQYLSRDEARRIATRERVAEYFVMNPTATCRKIQAGISSASVLWFHLQRIKGNVKTKEQLAKDCAALEARCEAFEGKVRGANHYITMGKKLHQDDYARNCNFNMAHDFIAEAAALTDNGGQAT